MMLNRHDSMHVTASTARTAGLVLVWASIVSLAGAPSAAAQPFAYVVGQPTVEGGPGVVAVIDTSANDIVTSIPAGASCRLCVNTDGIAIAPDVGRLYASNVFAQSVSVIDIASNAVVTTVPIAGGPTAVVASPNGTRVYVLNESGAASVLEIDTATNTMLRTAPLAVLQARGMAITPDGARLYVSTYGSNSVKVVSDRDDERDGDDLGGQRAAGRGCLAKRITRVRGGGVFERGIRDCHCNQCGRGDDPPLAHNL